MGRRDGENASADGDRHREDERQRTPDHDGEHGYLTGPIEHGRQQRAPTANANVAASMDTFDHAAKRRARTGQGVADSGVTGDGDPGRPQRCLHEAVHSDQLDRGAEDGAQDPVLDEPRRRRSGDRTDNDRQHAGPQQRCPPPLGQPPPGRRCRWLPVLSLGRPRGRLPTAPQGASGPGREESSGK